MLLSRFVSFMSELLQPPRHYLLPNSWTGCCIRTHDRSRCHIPTMSQPLLTHAHPLNTTKSSVPLSSPSLTLSTSTQRIKEPFWSSTNSTSPRATRSNCPSIFTEARSFTTLQRKHRWDCLDVSGGLVSWGWFGKLLYSTNDYQTRPSCIRTLKCTKRRK